jgi:hypothetical protein
MNIVVITLLVLMLALIYRIYRRDVQQKIEARNSVFDDCETLLKQAKKTHDQAKLPVLYGRYEGYEVALSVVEDTIAWRKLPPLWLLIKVVANTPITGSLDLIVRPANNEFYSPSWQWDGNLSIPPNWPQHAILKYQQQAVDVALLDPFVPSLFADAKMKELLVTPSLLRLTYMLQQAERGEYLIMRNAVFAQAPIKRDVLEVLLKQAISVRQYIEDSQSKNIKVHNAYN